MSIQTAPATAPGFLIDASWPSAGSQALRRVILILAGTALLAISAKVQVPFWGGPVPLTMQTFVVIVLGAAYGWGLGLATILAYLAEGALGIPVFAGAVAGPAYMAGPTGGYLIGFVLGAGLCGGLAARGWDRSLWQTAIAMTLGHLVILGCGVTWLALALHMGFDKAWAVGFMPFVSATLLKTALAVAVMPLAWRIAKR